MEDRKSRYELFLEEEARKNQPTKRCTKCKEIKALSEFNVDKKNNDGRQYVCRACSNARRRKYKSREDRFWKCFWPNTKRVGTCLEWEGGHDKFGRVPSRVRRTVYRLAVGGLPDDMCVLMVCRNKNCVSQYHMKLGTIEDREIDRQMRAPTGDRHGAYTHPERRPRGDDHYSRKSPERMSHGSKHWRAKLTEDQIREIRTLRAKGESLNSLARMFGVGKSTAWHIINGETWKHVE